MSEADEVMRVMFEPEGWDDTRIDASEDPKCSDCGADLVAGADADELWCPEHGVRRTDTGIDVPDRFRIDGENTAAWAMLRYTDAKAQERRVLEVAAELRRRADEYAVSAAARPSRDAAFFERLLREYHAEVVGARKGSKPSKKVDLPSGGSLSTRNGSVSTEVTDPAALLAWLEEREVVDAIEYQDPKLKANILKDRFSAKVDDTPGIYDAVSPDGEAVPGVVFVRGVESFTITVPAVVAPDEDGAL